MRSRLSGLEGGGRITEEVFNLLDDSEEAEILASLKNKSNSISIYLFPSIIFFFIAAIIIGIEFGITDLVYIPMVLIFIIVIYGKYLEHKIKEQYNKCWHPVVGKKSNPLLAFILIIMPFNIGSIALIVYVSYKVSLIIDDGSIHIRPEYILFIAMINIMVIIMIIKLL